MRDIIVMAIVLGSVPICFLSPYFGVLMWTWIAYFNPHRLTYGFAYRAPVAMIVAIPTLAGLFFNRKFNRNAFNRETVLLLLLWFWFGITLLYAMNEPIFSTHVIPAKEEMIRVSKILLMTFVTIVLVTSKEKLRYLSLVIALSIGFYAVKGAFFGFRVGGVSRVWGPPDSFIADNNDLALATNMTLPILFYLAKAEQTKWLRRVLGFTFICGIVSVILSYSRGGLLGLSTVLGVLAMRSRHKVLAIALLVMAGILVLSFAPPAWMDRMGQFAHGKLDTSAEGRLHAWEFAIVLTQHYPITGGGFQTFTPDLFERFTPDLTFAGPHSIYFEFLGEQGYVGLGIFLALIGCCWGTLRKLVRRARDLPSTEWLLPYARMIQVSLLAYMVSGAFLPRGYFDYFYQLVAMTIVMKGIYQREVAMAAATQIVKPYNQEVGEVLAT